MANLFWYILLGVISFGISIYTICVKRHTYKVSTLIVFYLAAASFAWIGEFIVLGLFNSYAYKTGVFTNLWQQNLFGHLILNTTLYPMVAVVMVAFSLSWGWISFVTAVFILIEYFFVRMDIYEQHWWTYYITAMIVVAYLLISKYWFAKMIQKPYGWVRAITFYFAAMVSIHTPAPILLLLGKQYYQLGFINKIFVDRNLSSIIIIFSYHLIEAFLNVLFICVLKKWYWKLVPFIFPLAVQTIFAKMGILIMEDEWKLVYTILIYEAFLVIFVLLEKYSLKPERKILE